MLMERVHDTVTARILREADIDAQVAAELEKIERPDLTPEGAEERPADHPSEGWRSYVEEIVEEIVDDDESFKIGPSWRPPQQAERPT